MDNPSGTLNSEDGDRTGGVRDGTEVLDQVSEVRFNDIPNSPFYSLAVPSRS